MALHWLADSTDLRFLVPFNRTYSLTLELPVLSGPPFESSPATLLDVVRGFLGQKAWETFRKFSFVLSGNAAVPEPADIQPNSAEWRHLTTHVPNFQGSHEKSVVGPVKLGLQRPPASTWSISFLASPLVE